MNDSSDPKSQFEAGFTEWFTSGQGFSEPRLDVDTLCSVALHMHFKDEPLARGSGFFWRLNGSVALVTAWHNFTGLHHTLRHPLHSQGGMPDRVVIRYTARNPTLFQEATLPLYLDDNMETPRWFVHGKCGGFFDICFVHLFPQGHEVVCVNDRFELKADYVEPGESVFVVGYPQGINTLGLLPIWKRGSMASELRLPTEGHPKFLIDVAGRSGMSGAPVYRVQRGMVVTDSATEAPQFGLGFKREFVGLYSGRLADQTRDPAIAKEGSDLGTVWRSDIVAETLATGLPDEKPETGKGKISFTPIWEPGPSPK